VARDRDELAHRSFDAGVECCREAPRGASRVPHGRVVRPRLYGGLGGVVLALVNDADVESFSVVTAEQCPERRDDTGASIASRDNDRDHRRIALHLCEPDCASSATATAGPLEADSRAARGARNAPPPSSPLPAP